MSLFEKGIVRSCAEGTLCSGYCKSHFVFKQRFPGWLLIANRTTTVKKVLQMYFLMFGTSKPNAICPHCIEVVAEVSATCRDLKPLQINPKLSAWLDTIGGKW